ncbi:MAG: hypothetical protein QOI96_984 [Verrucomicrobiota bacterium]
MHQTRSGGFPWRAVALRRRQIAVVNKECPHLALRVRPGIATGRSIERIEVREPHSSNINTPDPGANARDDFPGNRAGAVGQFPGGNFLVALSPH